MLLIGRIGTIDVGATRRGPRHPVTRDGGIAGGEESARRFRDWFAVLIREHGPRPLRSRPSPGRQSGGPMIAPLRAGGGAWL